MFNNSWDIVLHDILESHDFKDFLKYIYNEYNTKEIYPKKDDLFKSLILTDYIDVKVVILGQDPYHQKGQANGLAFSVNKDTKIPPSLNNIFKEIYRDLGINNTNGNLEFWAKQGVLLLNTVLTVEDSKPRSYANSYWNIFTDAIIKKLSEKENIIFLLWGNDAIKKEELISDSNFVLKSTHPSPLSAYRGFNGCGHFSKANKILKNLKKLEINWSTN